MTVILDGRFERKYLVCDTRPMSEDAALEKGIEFRFDKLGQARPGLKLDLGQKGLEMFLDHLVEDGFFGAPPLVVDAFPRRRKLDCLVHRP